MSTKSSKIKRQVGFIVVHCSDSDIKSHDNVGTIRSWHLERGFNDIGYHAFIDKSGVIHEGRPEHIPGAHVRGFNQKSLAVCLSGRHKFTEAQFASLDKWCKEKCEKYNLKKTDILSHCELDNNKTCPNFNVIEIVARWSWH